MAIRPIDLQGVIANAAQAAPLARQGEEASKLAQTAAQNAHVNKLEERTETVQASDRGHGNRVNADGEGEQFDQPKKGKRQPGRPFDNAIDTGSAGVALSGEAHIIDFSA